MKREMTVKLGGKRVKLAATFRASVDIAEEVGDPLEIARESSLEAIMISSGVPYKPKFSFNVRNVPQILHIAQEAAGGTMDLEEVQEAVFDTGFMECKDIAGRYIALLVTPTSKEITAEKASKSEAAEKK